MVGEAKNNIRSDVAAGSCILVVAADNRDAVCCRWINRDCCVASFAGSVGSDCCRCLGGFELNAPDPNTAVSARNKGVGVCCYAGINDPATVIGAQRDRTVVSSDDVACAIFGSDCNVDVASCRQRRCRFCNKEVINIARVDGDGRGRRS